MIPAEELLREIKDYVIVVGSYASGKQTECSDIDLLIKTKPESLWEEGEDTYKNEIKQAFEKFGVECKSDIIDSFMTLNTDIPLDLSTLFNEPQDTHLGKILGVEMEIANC